MAHPSYKTLVNNLFNHSNDSKPDLNQLRSFSNIEELFDLLCQEPGLKTCFNKSAFVGEGYTILEHSKRVVQTATQFRAQLEPKLLVPWNEFILFLALHDIGKGIARETLKSQSPDAMNTFRDKMAELAVSRLILKKIMLVCDIPLERQKIYGALLKQDLIGDYLKDQSHLEQAFHLCLQLAAEANLAPQQMFDMFVVFHQCDAASYPFLRDRIFEPHNEILVYSEACQQKIATLQYELNLVTEGEKAYKQLTSDIQNQSSPAQIKQKFDQFLPNLVAYLENVKTQLLSLKSRSETQRSYFSDIKKGFRNILINLYKVKDDNSSFNFQERVKSYIEDKHELNIFDFSYEWQKVHFRNLLVSFRNDFHVRFSRDKISKKIASVSEDSDFTENFEHFENVFFHGTNSALLVNLPLTDYYMIPSGKLTTIGVTPLCGELGRGATLHGINQKRLSGVPFSDIQTAINYSSYFKTDIQKLKSHFDETIQQLDAQMSAASKNGRPIFSSTHDLEKYNGQHLSNLAYMILKIRTLQSVGQYYDESQLQNEYKTIKQLICQLQVAFKRYKETNNYHTHMPKSKDKRFRSHDDCYRIDFEIYEHSLESVLNALDSRICVPDAADLAFAEDAFPIVIAAHNIHTEPHGESTEIFSNRPLQFGNNIKNIYVHEENRAQMENWLVRHGLQSKIRIHDIKLLNVAYSYQTKLESYLNDIVSEKKLNHLLAAGTTLVDSLPKIEPIQKPSFEIDTKQQMPSNLVWRALNRVYNFVRFPKTMIERMQINAGIATSDTQPVYKAESGAAAAYWAGRESQYSWLSYFKSYVSKDAYRLSSYYLGVYDEKYNVDSKIRFEPK